MTTTTTTSGLRALIPAGLASLVVTAVALIMVAAPASAHVGVASASTTDAVTTINFAFDHGCGSSPTVALEMQLPESAQVVSTQLMDGWVLDDTSGDGASSSRQVARISGPAIPDGQPATFSIVATGYDTSVDHLIPTVQVCTDGQEAWIDPDQESAQAAPLVTATTTEPPAGLTDEPAPGATTPTTVGAEPAVDDLQTPIAVTADDSGEATDTGSSSPPWGIIIAVVVAAGVATAIVLVTRSRRTVA